MILLGIVVVIFALAAVGWLDEWSKRRRRRRAVPPVAPVTVLPMFQAYRVGVDQWAAVGRGSRWRYHLTADAEEAHEVARYLSGDPAAVAVELRATQTPELGAPGADVSFLQAPAVIAAIEQACRQARQARLVQEG